MVTTPRSKWPVIAGAFALYAATPVVEYVYYSTELARGSYPTNADSIGIPLFQTCVGLAIAAPFFLVLLWASTRRYVAASPLTAWTSEAPICSVLWTVILGGLAATLLIDGAILGYHRHVLSFVHRAGLACAFLFMRAAAVSGCAAQPAVAPDDLAAGEYHRAAGNLRRARR